MSRQFVLGIEAVLAQFVTFHKCSNCLYFLEFPTDSINITDHSINWSDLVVLSLIFQLLFNLPNI